MNFSKLLASGILTLSFAPVMALPLPSVGPKFADVGTVTQFEVNDKTAVPNRILKAGNYTITVVDHLSDRMVLRIVSDKGKDETTFLALPGGSRIPTNSVSGPVSMTASSGSKGALRGFVFPNGAIAEFVYPKQEAVPLAKANGTTVPAIDPASEGRLPASKLSKADLEVVTLWMLTPTVVGTNHQPAIEAARYQPEIGQPANTTEMASSTPPPSPSRSFSAPPARPVQEALATVPPAPKPRAMTHPIAALPHTASSLPMFLLIGGLAFFLAVLLGVRRVAGTAVR